MVGKDAQVVEWTLAPTGLNFAMGSSQKSRFAPLEAAASMVPPWLGSIRISGLWPTLGSPSRSQAHQLGSVGLFLGVRDWERSCLWQTGYFWLLGEHKIQLGVLELRLPTGELWLGAEDESGRSRSIHGIPQGQAAPGSPGSPSRQEFRPAGG